MEAIVLAGGLGTRLQKVVSDLPKSLAQINNRPFLEYLFDYLIFQGVTRVILSVGYKHDLISGHFGNQYKSLPVQYSIENEPLGTGGGIRLALWKVEGQRALVMNGDSLFKLDYKALMAYHIKKKPDATIALRKLKDTGRYGSVSLDRTRRITGFKEKARVSGSGYINGGVYVIEKYFLMEPEFRGRFSIERDCFEQYYPELKFYGFPADGFFMDIGIPEDYLKAQHEFAAFKD
ncbi:MAG: nucleotidyltransferase family protein [Bacteroidales bacterium]|nr:nucleotidyltransferase family protein [Bacteroidales bacterium]